MRAHHLPTVQTAPGSVAAELWCGADRELALFKVGAPHGTARSEVLELTSIFGGKVVDVGPNGLTIALSGDVGKVFAFEQSLRAFGLAELSRTGRITLQTSDANLDMPGSLSYAPSQRRATPPSAHGAAGAPPRPATSSPRFSMLNRVVVTRAGVHFPSRLAARVSAKHMLRPVPFCS